MLRLLMPLLLVVGLLEPLVAQQKNSTRKIRIEPSDFSRQCGSAVPWRGDLQQAMQESQHTGKPVFWYVPTIHGSFMDRQPVIDQYMMAGPFSWPAVVELLRSHFIPVKSEATPEWQERYDKIQAYHFVEPGFVVLNPDGSVRLVIDQLTTLDPTWLAHRLAQSIEIDSPPVLATALSAGWQALRRGDRDFDPQSLVASDADVPEKELLRGMLVFQQGQHQRARQIWAELQQSHPDHPLAWKGAAEAENWGPFCRGFEVHADLDHPACRDAGLRSRGSAAVPGVYQTADLWDRGTQFLMSMQAASGGWFDSDYDFGGTDSLPNVHMAVTALCGSALLEALRRPGDRRPQVRDAVESAADYCADARHINSDDRDEILWAQAYRVRFLAKLVQFDADYRSKYAEALSEAVRDLQVLQTNRGTWYHEYANPFVTATALTALKRAADAGAQVDTEIIQRGVASLANDRFDNGAFPYYGQKQTRQRGDTASSGSGKIPASAGRMPLCELGLWQWNGSSDERLQQALQAAFENHRYLAVGYKYDNHTSTMSYGGFFFWYDMRSRAEALTFMADRDKQATLAQQHRDLVLALPELDGCFVDSHELGRCYGTAMALLTLALLDETQN